MKYNNRKHKQHLKYDYCNKTAIDVSKCYSLEAYTDNESS